MKECVRVLLALCLAVGVVSCGGGGTEVAIEQQPSTPEQQQMQQTMQRMMQQQQQMNQEAFKRQMQSMPNQGAQQ